MKKLKTLLLIMVCVLVILLGFWVVVENPQVVTVRLGGQQTNSLPLGGWLLLLFSAGVLFGSVCGFPSLIAQKRKVRALSRKLNKPESRQMD